MTDERTANWQRARDGARQTLDKSTEAKRRQRVMRRALADEQARLRDLSSVELILLRLRIDILSGVPAAALVDRIDDELFKLKK